MRPLINFSIHELEEQFDAKKHDLAFLNRLLSELKNRKTKRATDLRNRTIQALGVLPKFASPVRPKSQRHDEIERPLPEDDAPHSTKLPKAVKGLSDEPDETSAQRQVVFPVPKPICRTWQNPNASCSHGLRWKSYRLRAS